MLWKIVGPYIVCVHGAENPTDDEWYALMSAQYQHALRHNDTQDKARVLVFTAGGVPNAPQRAALNKVAQTFRTKSALLTSSAIARAIGTALRWFDAQLGIFGPDEVEPALNHIEATGEYRLLLRSALRELTLKMIGPEAVTTANAAR
jgi:hypothetical protein